MQISTATEPYKTNNNNNCNSMGSLCCTMYMFCSNNTSNNDNMLCCFSCWFSCYCVVVIGRLQNIPQLREYWGKYSPIKEILFGNIDREYRRGTLIAYSPSEGSLIESLWNIPQIEGSLSESLWNFPRMRESEMKYSPIEALWLGVCGCQAYNPQELANTLWAVAQMSPPVSVPPSQVNNHNIYYINILLHPRTLLVVIMLLHSKSKNIRGLITRTPSGRWRKYPWPCRCPPSRIDSHDIC
jgi:hypothetical protein